MSQIPPSLNLQLKKFQVTSHTLQRIQCPGTFGSAGQLTFQFPRSGVIDLHSLACVATATLTGTGTILGQPFNSGMVRKVSITVGGQSLGCDASDYGFISSLMKIYQSNKPQNDFKQSALEGNVTFTTATAKDIIIASSFEGTFLSNPNCRYLVLDVLPEIVVTLDLKSSAFWASATTLTDASLTNVAMIYSSISFENNLLANLYADRVQKTPIEIAYPNMRYYEGSQLTTNGSTVSMTVNSGSVEYVVSGSRPDYSAGLTTAMYLSNNATGLSQMFYNGTPLQSWAMNTNESLLATMASLNSFGSTFSPDFSVGTAVQPSSGEYGTNYFALWHRMKFDTEIIDGANFQSGVNTFGSGSTIDYIQSSTSTTARRPWIAVLTSAVLQIGAGKNALSVQ